MSSSAPFSDPVWLRWLSDVTERHRRDLTFAEVRKGVQALSDVYVHRKAGVTARAVGGAGKRAAFASFYGPLHYALTHGILEALDASTPREILDLGCGTGVMGAAWARRANPASTVVGVDTQPWALDEARRTYSQLGLRGRVKRGDLARERLSAWGAGRGVVLGFAVNELSDDARARLLRELQAALQAGGALLVIEPIAKSPVPWWSQWAAALAPMGARENEWKLRVELPPALAEMDRAAKLDHRVLKGRSLWAPGTARA